jgi:hypothetical protein
MAEMSPYPRAGDPSGGPTAKYAVHKHLPTTTWADDEEEQEDQNVTRGWRVTKWNDTQDEDENERLSWKAVRWAQRLAAQKFGA